MRSSVCYNLKISPYTTYYKCLLFFFSSKFNKNRFEKKLETDIEIEKAKLQIKYHCKINAEQIIALNIYQNIEKRGFYVLGGNNLPLSKDFEVEMVILND